MIYLGIDSGTQSTKTIAVDIESGEVLASSQAAYAIIDGLPAGHLEQHPQDWIGAVEKPSAILGAIRTAKRVRSRSSPHAW